MCHDDKNSQFENTTEMLIKIVIHFIINFANVTVFL